MQVHKIACQRVDPLKQHTHGKKPHNTPLGIGKLDTHGYSTSAEACTCLSITHVQHKRSARQKQSEPYTRAIRLHNTLPLRHLQNRSQLCSVPGIA